MTALRPTLIAMILPLSALAGDAPAPACKYPVSVLWHADVDGSPGQHRMAVSVVNDNGQQVPGLTADNFAVFHRGAEVKKDGALKVVQASSAFAQAKGEGGEALGADPMSYDVYFAVDLTKSMAAEIAGPSGATKPKLGWAAQIVASLVAESKGTYALFDAQDRVYVSGFGGKLETGFTDGPTADRQKIRDALLKLNSFAPKDEAAALYAGLLHNLSAIQASAAEYADPKKKRQAVLIAVTDSWNGTDPATGKVLRGCSENDALTDMVRQEIVKTRTATGNQMKLYVMGLGDLGENDVYKLKGPSGKKCRIAALEGSFLDGRAMNAIGDRELSNGGFQASRNPGELASWVIQSFSALKTAYEVTYAVPAESPKPGSYRAKVTIGDASCEDEIVEKTGFVPQATAEVATKPSEMAVFLAASIIALFFLPRSLSNLGNLGGGGGGSSAKKSKPAPKKKKKK